MSRTDTLPHVSGNGNGATSQLIGAKPTESPNPFDPERLRLAPDMSASMGMEQVQTNIPVCKPNKAWWVQVCPDEQYQLATMIVELKDDQEVYLVAPEMQDAFVGDQTYKPVLLLTAVARPKNQMFLWPVPLTAPGEKENKWHASARSAANLAKGAWVRIMANMAGGGYDVWKTTADLPAPKWPTQPFGEILRAAFQSSYIDTPEHPIYLRLKNGQ